MTRNRLGSWEPATGEDRLSRIESLAEIRQLAMRNAMAIDAVISTCLSICSRRTCELVATSRGGRLCGGGTTGRCASRARRFTG